MFRIQLAPVRRRPRPWLLEIKGLGEGAVRLGLGIVYILTALPLRAGYRALRRRWRACRARSTLHRYREIHAELCLDDFCDVQPLELPLPEDVTLAHPIVRFTRPTGWDRGLRPPPDMRRHHGGCIVSLEPLASWNEVPPHALVYHLQDGHWFFHHCPRGCCEPHVDVAYLGSCCGPHRGLGRHPAWLGGTSAGELLAWWEPDGVYDWEHAGYTAILVGERVPSTVDLELLSTLLGVAPAAGDQRLEVFIPADEPEPDRARDILDAFRAAAKKQ